MISYTACEGALNFEQPFKEKCKTSNKPDPVYGQPFLQVCYIYKVYRPYQPSCPIAGQSIGLSYLFKNAGKLNAHAHTGELNHYPIFRWYIIQPFHRDLSS